MLIKRPQRLLIELSLVAITSVAALLALNAHDAYVGHVTTFVVLAAGIVASAIALSRSMRAIDRAREAQLMLEHRQREAERLSSAITRHLPNGRVAVVDTELRYVFADGQGLREIPGFEPDAIRGKTIAEVYPAAVAAMLEKLARGAFRGEEPEGELEHGSKIYRVTAVPLEDDASRVDRVLLLTQDITELKLAQRTLEERNRQLQELSFTDALLDIANRRAFDRGIEREWRRAQRKRQPLALLLMDVDHFKLFNDTYGHTEGDECLQRVAAVLEETVARPGDLVARYGGEEFAVLLPECDLTGALCVADRIHACLAEAAIPFAESPLGTTVTVSIGAAAVLPRRGLALGTLIEAADDALYVAKDEGRNRTATATEDTVLSPAAVTVEAAAAAPQVSKPSS
jgi:diguanylate cyclase (GGDEF)-like protein